MDHIFGRQRKARRNNRFPHPDRRKLIAGRLKLPRPGGLKNRAADPAARPQPGITRYYILGS